MNELDIQQFKLSTGDELICEVLNWKESEVKVRKVLKVASVYLDEDTENVYVFRPWMTYSTDFDEVVSINPHNIVATCEPSYIMEMQYYEGLDIMRKHMKDLEASYKSYEEDRDDSDSGNRGNVVKMFRSDDTLH